MRLVELAAGPGGSLAEAEHVAIGEAMIPPGAPVPPSRALFMLEGELAIGEGRAGAGAWVQIPAGGESAAPVAGDAGARVLRVIV